MLDPVTTELAYEAREKGSIAIVPEEDIDEVLKRDARIASLV